MLAPRQHALLIGIDRYPSMADRWQLRGCVNDVRSLARLLGDRYGFPPESAVLLENEAATRDGVLGAFRELRERVAPGDVVVVAYSGHGSRVRDEGGGAPDGWSESIVPADSGRGDHPNRDILDREIHAWLLDLSAVTPYITLVFDSCFSGGITRDPFAARTRWLEPDPRPARALPSPAPLSVPRAARPAGRGPSGWLPWSDRYVLLAACRHDEYANESQVGEGDQVVHYGTLSYYLQRELAAAGPDASHRDLFERVSARVTADFPRQHPQLEGARDRELFGARALAPLSPLVVRARQGSRVVLAAGAAHGLSVGSEWAVYPQGTKAAAAATPELGRLQVCRVEAVAAEAAIVEEGAARPIAPGDCAVERIHDYGEMRLLVELCGPEAPAVEALREAFRRSPLLRLADPGEAARVRVYLLYPRGSVEDGDAVPALGAIGEATWAAVGCDGELIIPLCPAGESGVIAHLMQNLEARARYDLALRLHNVDPESRLAGKIELRLLRRRGVEWVAAETDAAGDAVYYEGDHLACEVRNGSDLPVYVSVLDFGLSGRVAPLYPVPGSHKELVPGLTLRVGMDRGEEMELFIPSGFPFAPAARPAEGTEHVKLFATTAEADFAPLLQEGYRSARGRAGLGPLGELLAAAMTGSGRRETRPPLHAPAADWTTVVRSFLLRRK